MELKLINIGNSKGIRIPKTILEKYQITDKMELIMNENSIELKPLKFPREGWDKAFQVMNENKDDELLIPDVFEEEDFD